MLISDYIYTLSALLFIVFVIREIVAYKHILFFKYLLTPIITAITVLIVVIPIGFYGIDRYSLLILSSVVSALIADTLLMIEEVNYLKNGIIFFMISHLLYIIAFSGDFMFKTWNLLLIVLICVVNYFMIKIVKKNAGRMLIPVVIYIIIIDVMGYLAITKLNNGSGLYEVTVASAALLFWISDLILSINAFAKEIPHSTFYTWLFYAPAQFLFALSVFLVKHS